MNGIERYPDACDRCGNPAADCRCKPSMQAVLAMTLDAHLPAGTDQKNRPYKTRCRCGEWWYDFNHHRARVLAAAIRAWLTSDAVRSSVVEHLLTEAMDGDYLIAAGRSIGNEGGDVAMTEARPSELTWWAADNALAAAVEATATEESK